MKENRILLLIIIIGIFLVIGYLIYYYKILPSIITGGSSAAPKSPMIVTLSVSPFTGEKIAELTVTITSIVNAPNTTAQIILPEGIELQSGNSNWSGDITENGTVKFSTMIKAVKMGEWIVEADARTYTSPDSWFGGKDIIYFIVCEDVKVSDIPPKNWYEGGQAQAIPLPENNEMISSNISFSSLPELNKEVILTYTVTPSIDIPDPQRTWMTLVYPPKGFEVIGVEFPSAGETYTSEGQLTWKGKISKDETVQIKAIVKAITTGSGSVYGHLNVQPDGKTITRLISDISMFDVKVGECYVIVEKVEMQPVTPPNITCRGVVCDGFCFTDHIVCNNDKIIYTEYGKYFIHEKGETIYSSTDVPFNVYVDYPRSVYPNETINLNVTIESTSSANEVTINNINLIEWKPADNPFWYCDFSIIGAGYNFENNTDIVLSVPSHTNKTISYNLNASPYPTPFGVRIFITLNLYNRVITNPITVYNITRKTKCGNKIFDSKVGSCSDEILYPSRCGRGCNSDQMCHFGYRCIDHECEQRSRSQFQANTSYEIPIVPLYLLRNKTLADYLRISERPYMDSIASNATNWWDNEIAYLEANITIKHEVIDCEMYLDEYLSIAQQYSNDTYKAYNEIISRCNLDRGLLKIISFFHINDPDVVYPIYESRNLEDIILIGGFYYYNSTDPRGKYYSRGNASEQAEILIHETLHSFGVPDIYVYPGRTYYQYDCYMNTQNKNFTKHLCPMEAFLSGIIFTPIITPEPIEPEESEKFNPNIAVWFKINVTENEAKNLIESFNLSKYKLSEPGWDEESWSDNIGGMVVIEVPFGTENDYIQMFNSSDIVYLASLSPTPS